MQITLIGLLAALATSAVALSTPSNHVLHEKRTAPLKKWIKRSEVDGNAKLPMRIGLTQTNIHNGEGAAFLDDMFVAVSGESYD